MPSRWRSTALTIKLRKACKISANVPQGWPPSSTYCCATRTASTTDVYCSEQSSSTVLAFRLGAPSSHDELRSAYTRPFSSRECPFLPVTPSGITWRRGCGGSGNGPATRPALHSSANHLYTRAVNCAADRRLFWCRGTVSSYATAPTAKPVVSPSRRYATSSTLGWSLIEARNASTSIGDTFTNGSGSASPGGGAVGGIHFVPSRSACRCLTNPGRAVVLANVPSPSP